MAGRASILGAAETNVGNVRDHNEDCHFVDPELGLFIVCDGRGGHAAGEVASALAVKTIREHWAGDDAQHAVDRWLAQGSPGARKEMLASIVDGVVAAHQAIAGEAEADPSKAGMGTTLIGALVVGGEAVFAHCGDSRAYLVRDGMAMQLTEDQTLLARLLAAGVDVDVHGEGARFRSMLTNAVGIGAECKVATFIVPLADGDRFLLCSDGVHEYIEEKEIGEVLLKMPSPARAAQRLVELALERGGADNATALVVRVLEAGDTARTADAIRREDLAIHKCPLWLNSSPQQRLRALRIALPRDYPAGERLPANTLGDRVAWIIVEGELELEGQLRGPGSLLYPEALLADSPLPDKEGLAITESEVRALALRADDFRELCEDEPDIGEALLAAIGAEIAVRHPFRSTGREPAAAEEPRKRSNTDLGLAVSKPSLIVGANEVEGDLERAMFDMTEPGNRALASIDDADSQPPTIAELRRGDLSEPEIEIAPHDDSEGHAAAIRKLDTEERTALLRQLGSDEIGALVRELDPGERAGVFRLLEPKKAAAVMRSLEPNEQAQLVHELDATERAEMLRQLGADAVLRELDVKERAAVLLELDAQERVAVLRQLEADDAAALVRELPAEAPDDEPEIEVRAEEPEEEEGEVRVLEADEPETYERTLLTHAGDVEDDLDREWDQAEHVSEVRAARAIEALEAEAIVDELSSDDAPTIRPRTISEDIDVHHAVEVGDLDDDQTDGSVIEILKDTSSQTITMTVPDEEPEAKAKA